jgi:hypothetical protein
MTHVGDVDGVPLVQLFVDQGDRGARFPPLIGLRIIASLCGRLHAAHVAKNDDGTPKGFVHGALGLSSVLVGRDGQVRFDTDPRDTSSSEPGPEQLAGHAPTVASDVYACGVMLYLLLTNEHPFWKDDRELEAQARRSGAFEPPSVVFDLPPALVEVVMRAMAHAPEQRYPTAKAIQAAIEKLFDEPGWAVSAGDVARFVKELETKAPPKPRKRWSASDLDIFALPDEDAPPASHSTFAQQVFGELEALGFRRIGVMMEIIKQSGDRTPSVHFAAPQHGAFASVFFTFDTIPRMYFYTMFQDGRFVLTAAYQRASHRKPRAVCTGHPNQPFAKVLEAHLAEAQAMVAQGARPGTKWDLEELVHTTVAYYENEDRP